MDVKLELQGINRGISGPGGEEFTVTFIVQSDLGAVKLDCIERWQKNEKLDDIVYRARARIVQFAQALQKDAAEG